MHKKQLKILVIVWTILLITTSTAKSFAVTKEHSYSPYLQVGGVHYFQVKESKAAMGVDLFIPIWQRNLSNLVFADIRLNDRTGSSFEGNMQLGYRHLFSSKQKMWGIYGAYDRRKTSTGNFFNQVVLGGEYWIKNWFFGGNIYKPFGKTTRNIDKYQSNIAYLQDKGVYNNIAVTDTFLNEKALPGVDAEVGYEFIDGLVGYVGGYYFKATGIDAVCGPKVRLTYDWSLGNRGKILGILDKIGLEAGVKNDKLHKTTYYLSANLRIGLLPDSNSGLKGVSRHMVDLVRRDVDIIATNATEQKIHHETGRVVDSDEELKESVEDKNVKYVDVHYNFTSKSAEIVKNAFAKRDAELNIVIDGNFDIETIGKPDGKHYHVHTKQRVATKDQHSRGEISVEALKIIQDLKGKVNVLVIEASINKEKEAGSKSSSSNKNADNKETGKAKEARKAEEVKKAEEARKAAAEKERLAKEAAVKKAKQDRLAKEEADKQAAKKSKAKEPKTTESKSNSEQKDKEKTTPNDIGKKATHEKQPYSIWDTISGATKDSASFAYDNLFTNLLANGVDTFFDYFKSTKK